ncbi:hypothetical protein [Embleya sp. NPDC050493]
MRSTEYGVEPDVAGPWEIGDLFALTGIRLSVRGSGTGRPGAGPAAES